MGYTQLSLSERYQIYERLKRRWTVSQIAVWMRRSRSTIYRELKRNRGGNGWRPGQAHNMAVVRRFGKSGPRLTAQVWEEVERLLREGWSPEQISRRLRLEQHVRISHEWIYQYLYRDRRHGGQLYRYLRQRKPYRKRMGRHGARGRLRGTMSIEERPRQAETRIWFGHWEGDTVLGKAQRGAFVTLVERKARYTVARRLLDRNSDDVGRAVCEALSPIRHRVKTITFDNGHEFARHRVMAEALDAHIYFTHTHSPWERGTNENTNGLLRQYYPKRRRLDTVAEEELAQVVEKLNHRPRKCLGYRTPHEVFFGEKTQLTVALTS